MNDIKILFLCTISVIILIPSNGERTKDKMYETIESTAACFRRLNATHQTGCTSKSPGSVGVIHVIANETDLNFVLKTGPVPPYIPVIGVDKLTHKLINQFTRYSDRVAGLVVHRNITRPREFSQELSCPNDRSNIAGTCSAQEKWNPHGTALMHANIPFPVFLVQDNENLAKIINCFEKFNNYDLEYQSMRSLCALQLAAFMFATNDSRTCIKRGSSWTTFTPTRFCDPLGSRNVWASVPPRVNKTDVILVTSQLDTTSMFYDLTPGAVAPLTGVVTLMTTAHILKEMVGNDTFDKTIMFVLFNGETYDYIGSQRFVYDVVNKAFPMKKNDEIKHQVPQLSLSDIQLIVELGQLNMKPGTDIFMHHLNEQTSISNFIKIYQKYAANYGINTKEQTVKNRIPPSSMHSFLRENKTLEGLIIANHDDVFSNDFYHSFYDDKININYEYENIKTDGIQQYIHNISRILAKSLYEELSGKPYAEEPEDSVKIVDELFHCYLDTANCSLIQAVTTRESISENPLPLYVSVDPYTHRMTSISGYMLGWLTGHIVNKTKSDCNTDPHNPIYQLFWMSKNLSNINDTACIQTTMNYSVAISPAFVIEDYNWTSNRYSTWTESVWHDIYMRMFLVPSNRHEIMTISVGTVTFVLSLALVYFVHTRADILFAKPDGVSTPGTSC